MVDPITTPSYLQTLSYAFNGAIFLGALAYAVYIFFSNKKNNQKEEDDEIAKKREELQQIYTELNKGKEEKIRKQDERITELNVRIDELNKRLSDALLLIKKQEVQIQSMVPFTELRDLAQKWVVEVREDIQDIKNMIQSTRGETTNEVSVKTTIK